MGSVFFKISLLPVHHTHLNNWRSSYVPVLATAKIPLPYEMKFLSSWEGNYNMHVSLHHTYQYIDGRCHIKKLKRQ